MKEARFHLRLGGEEKALVRCAAKEAGVSASRFMREAAVRAAEEAIARQNRFVVPAGEWLRLVARLDDAGAPSNPHVRPTVEKWMRENAVR